jgi:chemotaxis protein methyltransferase CheR
MNYFSAKLSSREFKQLSRMIHEQFGIQMPPEKKVMLESRLRKRLKTLGMDTFKEYCTYLFSDEGMQLELVHMVDVVTTNKTDFFREAQHFDYLVNHALPDLILKYGTGIRRELAVWSAGCSSGEEPYTLSMVFSEFGKHYPGIRFDYFILATDLSTRVLKKASQAIYRMDQVRDVPMIYKKQYLLRSKKKNEALVRIVPELRERVRFRRLNFMDNDFQMREPMDLIFFRNVMIYFDRATQKRLIDKFYQLLVPGGFLFLGHSESISGYATPFQQVAPSVYRRP